MGHYEMKPRMMKCPICEKKYLGKGNLIDHIEHEHSSSIPEGWSAARYECYLRTGKTKGRCIICGKDTDWNPATGKYMRMCGSEECRKKSYELASQHYIGKHGHPLSLSDPEIQKKMIYSKKNSGKYVFTDEKTGKKYEVMYDSSYGKDFFEMIDTLLGWNGADIIAPSPHTYYYEYEGRKHFYIPDAYCPSLNLEIELKDGGSNPNKHPKIQAVDKVKERLKDEVMASLSSQVHYIKICNKDYTEFFALLSRLKAADKCPLPKWEEKLEVGQESVEFDGYDDEPVEDATMVKPFIKRSILVYDPINDYKALTDYYRKKVFKNKKMSPQEYYLLHKEMENVREYLKAIVNDKNKENEEHQRMKFAAQQALTEIENLLKYMNETNPYPVSENTKDPNEPVRHKEDLDDYGQGMKPHRVPQEMVESCLILESLLQTTLDPNFRPKGHIKLSSLNMVVNPSQSDFDKCLRTLVKPSKVFTGTKDDNNPQYRKYAESLNPDEFFYEVTENYYNWYVDTPKLMPRCVRDFIMWVTFSNEVVVFAVIAKSPMRPNIVQLDGFFINPKYRGQGVGDQAIPYLIQQYNISELDVEKDNEVARHLYEKHGFRISNTSNSFYQTRNDHQYIMRREVNVYESIMESSSVKLPTLYHVSKNLNLDGEILKPRVPKNRMTSSGNENDSIPRVCFSPDIDNCLMAIIDYTYPESFVDIDYAVYVPSETHLKYMSNDEIVRKKYVEDANITKETWILEPVKLKKVGIIHVSSRVKRVVKYKPLQVSGSDKKMKELECKVYEWSWKDHILEYVNPRVFLGIDDSDIEAVTEGKYMKWLLEPDLDLRPSPSQQKEVEALLNSTPKDRIFLSTDWHLFKPFGSGEKNPVDIDKIVEWCKTNIMANDVFIYLGDLCYRKATPEEQRKTQEIFKSLPGHKILIIGNHDEQLRSTGLYYKCGFDYVFDELIWGNLIFTHVPLRLPNGYINIHGHIHNENNYYDRYQPHVSGKYHLNTYPSFFGNKPVTLDYLLKHKQEQFRQHYYKEDRLITFEEVVSVYSTPYLLSEFMKANFEYLEYRSSWKLQTTNELLKSKKGNCIDQSYFEMDWFNHMNDKYKATMYLIIEYKTNPLKDSKQGHLMVIYQDNGMYYWLENSWMRYAGIHGPYNTVEEAEKAIRKFWEPTATLPNIWFGPIIYDPVDYGKKYVDWLKTVVSRTEEFRNIIGGNTTDVNESLVLESSYNREFTSVSDFHKNGEYRGSGIVSQVQEVASKTHTPNYFYHLIPKGVAETEGSITSLEYQYRHQKPLFHKNSEKYRERLVGAWGIYPGRTPESLTDDEVHEGICRFRKSESGCNQIYLFKFPPYYGLGKNMSNVLQGKDIYRIDINDPTVRRLINGIDWGYDFSHTGNQRLTPSYYDSITPTDYFSRYDDNGQILFAPLNHISISPKTGFISLQYWTKIEVSTRVEDIAIESWFIDDEDFFYNTEEFKTGKIRLALITGFSGAGKSTLTSDLFKPSVNFGNTASSLTDSKVNFGLEIESIELDDVILRASQWMMDIKKAAPIIREFYESDGAKFIMSPEERKKKYGTNDRDLWFKYYRDIYDAFVNWIQVKVKSTKKQFILNGLWPLYFHDNPERFKDWCIIIKGTSFVKSSYRAAKRDVDMKHHGNITKLGYFLDRTIGSEYSKDHRAINDSIIQWRKYFASIQNPSAESFIMESNYIEAKDDNGGIFYPVFIVLTYTGTTFGKLVKLFTKDTYGHASISFDTKMDKMLSFNQMNDGMLIEDLRTFCGDNRTKVAKYSIFMYLANSEEYDAMRKFVDDAVARIDKMKYNLLGVLKLIPGQFIFGRGSDREDMYFCSEFVAAVINAGNKKILNRPAYSFRPNMLAKIRRFKFIKRGKIVNFNPLEIDKIVAEKIKEGGFRDVIIK